MYGRVIRCVLSGSFHRDYPGLERQYRELVANGCQVLSPHRLHFHDTDTAFVVDEAEQTTSFKTLENHHLLSIKQADFLWLHVPDGYIGLSTAMELGFAKALNIPVFSNDRINDQTLREYVSVQPSVFAAIELLQVKND